MLGAFDTYEEAWNCASYARTKLVRYLVFLTLSSMHITKLNFQFVPLVSFDKEWTDEEVYSMCGLTSHEIEHVESLIRPLDMLNGGE